MKEQTKKNIKTAATLTGLALGTTYLVMRHIAKKQYPDSVYANQPEEQNPVEGRKVIFVEDANDPVNADGKQGHLEAVGNSTHIPTFYEKYIKRGFDVVLSFGGLVVLAPVYAVTALAIKADDPGPVFFKQKRVGTDKSYFELLKFRSMSVNTPKDVPTHMLKDGGITKVGAFIRKTSIDELPQLWNIFRGNMSVIGPRPALWNQDYLTAERDKYGANDVKPGLTGLAQISGRDELEIEEKAKLDGVYAKELKKSSLSGFLMDCKMFLGSISATLHSKGIVEGGTGAIAKEKEKTRTLVTTYKVNSAYSKITASIVTYNSADEIRIVLDTLVKAIPATSIYVIDNASSDETVSIVRNEYSEVNLIVNERNMGFGVAHNQAIRVVNSEYHIIVNPDIQLTDGSVDILTDYMDANEEVVCVTPRVLNDDGTEQKLPKYYPSIKFIVSGKLEKKYAFAKKWREQYTRSNEALDDIIPIQNCTGCFMFTRTSALKKVGGFDERYFLHFEDIDLSRMLGKIGMKVYNPNAVVIHKWHRDNLRNTKISKIAKQSMIKYYCKWGLGTRGY